MNDEQATSTSAEGNGSRPTSKITQGGIFKVVSIGLVERPVPPIRGHFTEQEMDRLVSSIRDNGVLSPLMVRPREDRYEVVDGDRRLHAAFTAGVREVPVMVYDLNDRETHILRMLANKDREDTDPVSEAKYISATVADGSMTIEDWCKEMGRSVAWVEDRLAIAEMPEYMQVAIASKTIALGVALELNQVRDDGTKERYFYDALRSGMTIHAAHISRLAANEAIDALREQGQEITEAVVPAAELVPKARCAITGELMPITAMRLVRVGIENYEKWQRHISDAASETPMVS